MIYDEEESWPPPKYLFGDKPTIMASKLNRNAIITGWIDFFCLVCDKYFETEDAAEVHTQSQSHKINLDETTYLEKYKEDCIRKVNAGYFCEYCNVLLSTNTKVNLHVEEKIHRNNRGFALLKYVGDDVAFKNVKIQELAWHGLSGDTCAICNSDVYDFKDHKTRQNHILNLVQGSIHFDQDKFLYRLVDDSSFQCLTCNEILASSSFAKHFDDPDHQAKYESSKFEKPIEVPLPVKEKKLPTLSAKDIRPQNPTIAPKESVENNTSTTATTENKSDVLDLIPLFQKNDINIDLITEKVYCKKCNSNMNFECNEILKHIDEHKSSSTVIPPVQPTVSTPAPVQQIPKPIEVKAEKEVKNTEVFKHVKCLTSSPASEKVKREKKERPSKELTSKEVQEKNLRDLEAAALEAYATSNKFIYTAGNSEAYCSVCGVSIIANLKNINKHIRGAIHKVKSAPRKKHKASAIYTLPKMRMKEFIKSVVHVESPFGHDVIINDKHCLTSNSYQMIIEQGSKLRCIICEISIDESDVKRHIKTITHESAMDRTPLILLDTSEFLREVRLGVYHCAWCHIVVGDWSNCEDHVRSDAHIDMKAQLCYRMSVHLPQILEHRKSNMNKRK